MLRVVQPNILDWTLEGPGEFFNRSHRQTCLSVTTKESGLQHGFALEAKVVEVDLDHLPKNYSASFSCETRQRPGKTLYRITKTDILIKKYSGLYTSSVFDVGIC